MSWRRVKAARVGRFCAAGLVGAVLSTTCLAAQDGAATWWWRQPQAPEVVWRGMLLAEGGGVGNGPQIGPYVVPGPLGLLAAVLTHGAIMQGVQSAQQKREQEEADKVLLPYGDLLKTWPASALWQAAAGGNEPIWDGSLPAPGAVMELVPVFTMAQDEGALLLDVAVKLVGNVGTPPLAAVVRVVSSPLKVNDVRAHWSADDAKALKTAAAAMLAHAARLARQHASTSPDDAPARTHRYVQGSVERSERAQQVTADCGRVVLRTLRGGLLSVPLQPALAAECQAQTTF
jgi:hypothetical protein